MFPSERVANYFHLYQRLLNFSELSWWLIDLDDDPEVFYCNNTMCETFHLDTELTQHSVSKTCPIAGDYNKYVAIKNSENAQKIFNDYKDLRHNRIREYSNRFPYYDDRKDKVYYFSSRAKVLESNHQGEASLLFGIIEQDKASEELQKLALVDSLTGLKNRREFDSQLHFLINLARREKRSISLILCDIDHFKLYNDNLGHYEGDRCLKQVADTLSANCKRDTDIVCRYGGEEYAVISYGEDTNAAALAENLRAAVYQLGIQHPEHPSRRVTISLGYVSVVPDQDTNARHLIEKADCALYMAKESGRNRSMDCFCSDPRIEQHTRKTRKDNP